MPTNLSDCIKSKIRNGFTQNKTTCGDPQAFLPLKSARCIEVLLRKKGLEKKNYFYTVTLKCAKAEYAEYTDTFGVICHGVTDGNHIDQAVELVENILVRFKEGMLYPEWD